MDIQPMHVWDPNLVHRVMRLKRTALERALGPHVCSGKSIYTLNEIDEDLVFKPKIQGEEYTIAINMDSCSVINLNNDAFSNKENDVKQQMINVIIKDAFRSTDLRQIGKTPRFFDTTNPIVMAREGLKIWSGFKASAYQSQMGCVLAIDNIFKFMSTKTCLDRLREINEKSHSKHQAEQICKLEFCGKPIIADWGNSRSYFVQDIDFETNPLKHEFVYNGQTINIATYFKNVYGKILRDVNQPLFVVKIADQTHYLPPEFCLVDGVSDSMKKSPGMREALKRTHITPEDKCGRIQKMADVLQAQKALKQWDLKIEAVPVEIRSRVMDAPKIFKGNQIIHVDENILRKLPIQKAVDLKHEQWIMIYAHGR